MTFNSSPTYSYFDHPNRVCMTYFKHCKCGKKHRFWYIFLHTPSYGWGSGRWFNERLNCSEIGKSPSPVLASPQKTVPTWATISQLLPSAPLPHQRLHGTASPPADQWPPMRILIQEIPMMSSTTLFCGQKQQLRPLKLSVSLQVTDTLFLLRQAHLS